MSAISRKKHRFGYLYAFFALYMQFILPIGSAVAAHPSNNDLLVGQAIVCTSIGVRYIDLQTGEDVTPRSDQVASRCPICLSIDNGTKIAPVPEITSQLVLNEVPVVHHLSEFVILERDHHVVYLSRAPPMTTIPV